MHIRAQAAACLHIGADYLLTRNPKDFQRAPVATRAPAEVLALSASWDPAVVRA